VTVALALGGGGFTRVALAAEEAAAPEIEPIITDRPDFTESTQTVPQGMIQIEGGYTYLHTGPEKTDSSGEVLIRVPAGGKTEVRLELPNYARVRAAGGRTSGFEDGSVGFKRVLAKGSNEFGLKRPRVSVIGSATLPGGSRVFRQNGLQPEVKLLLGADLSERVSLSCNFNYASLKDGSDRYSEISASLSAGVGLSDRVGTFLEVFAFAPSGGRENTRYVNGGFTYLVNNDFQLDVRAGVGLGNKVDGSDFFLGAGAARRF
jgi:hypothetical protein